MSPRPVSASSILDGLQAWGDQPVVNPVKLKEGVRPAPARDVPQSPARFAGLVLCALAALTAILFFWLLSASGVAQFIYAQF
jgi:hypothetical protein